MDTNPWLSEAEKLERSLMPVLVNWLRSAPMPEVDKHAGPVFAAMTPERKQATITALCNKLARERRRSAPAALGQR